jgi:hypothetical protein
MHSKLSELELEVLRKLVNGEAVRVSSAQRVRMELAGVIRDCARGIVVTPSGRELAGQTAVTAVAGPATCDTKMRRDDRGRRLPFQRRSVF